MKHIVVNTRLLIAGKLDGIGWFSHEVLKRLTASSPDTRFTFLFDRPFDDQFIYQSNIDAEVLFPPTRHPLLYRAYFEYAVPRALKRLKPDLFFSPDGFLSTRTDVPQIPVIHDINFEHRPDDLPKAYSKYYRHYFPMFARKASKIITVSNYSADDISRSYQVDRSKIHVAHNGYNPAYHAISDEEQRSTRSKLSGGVPYFLFVGNFSHRKNVHGIIQAYDLYRQNGGTHKMILVGDPLWKYHEMEASLKASPHQNDILFPGRLDLPDLTKAMGSATALVFPSFFEGFGIPVVEAFAAHTPVITSDNTALTEVAGEAALMTKPENIKEISSHMLSLQHDENLRVTLIERGKEQLSKFSWDACSNKVKIALFQ